jgi:LytS/YehU family sensor histidine kinase
MLSGIVAGSLMRVPVATYLNLHYFIPDKPQPGFTELFRNSLINIFIWVVCLVAGKLIFDRVRFQKYVDTMEKEKSKTELDFLKAQFNPHFLFNSINSIYGHIDKKNPLARNMLLTFSEMLRYQLYECNTEKINIDKEINYIKNYVTLQQIRMEEDLVVKLEIHENVKGFSIAPLMFIAFIENAFKYVGHEDQKHDCVEISLKKEEDRLLFRIYNTKELVIRKPILHKGIGIINVKRRLELLYPDKYSLDINNNDKFYEVNLNLSIV